MTADLRSLFFILLVAALAPLLAELPGRIRFPVVVAEIGLGIVIGPQVLDLAQPAGVVKFLSNIGLTFLFFLAGREVDLDRIRGLPGKLGGAGWLLSALLALGAALVVDAGGDLVSTLLLGVALCTTAIGTLMPILRDAGELRSELGPYVLSAGIAGEFGPLLLMALLLSSDHRPGAAFALLICFAVISLEAAYVALHLRPTHVIATIQRTMGTSGQLGLRLSLVLLSGLVYLASRFGFDIVLGAFAAGLVVGLVTKGPGSEELRMRFDGIGFGFAIPLFFVVTGMRFDLDALFRSTGTILRLPLFLALFLVVRGTPALLLYRRAIPPPDRLPLALYSATALPLVVAVTTIGLQTGRISSANAAALVGAAMTSVLVFPLVALGLRRRVGRSTQLATEGTTSTP